MLLVETEWSGMPFWKARTVLERREGGLDTS